MRKADFTIRLLLRRSQADPSRAAVRATLRLSDGRRMYFTSKGSVDYATARCFFTTDGLPYNPEKYDKNVYRIMRGMFMALQDAIMQVLDDVGYQVEDVTREAVKKEFDENSTVWNKNHGGEGEV